jgi:hypothetical protein
VSQWRAPRAGVTGGRTWRTVRWAPLWIAPALASSFRLRLPAAEVRVYPDLGHAPMEELPGPTVADAR